VVIHLYQLFILAIFLVHRNKVVSAWF
jgi:hypothetical protein